jgi:hypothetical protein
MEPITIARALIRLEPDGTVTDFKGRETAGTNTKPNSPEQGVQIRLQISGSSKSL